MPNSGPVSSLLLCSTEVERLLVCTSFAVFPLACISNSTNTRFILHRMNCPDWPFLSPLRFCLDLLLCSLHCFICLAQVLHSEVLLMLSCLNEWILNAVLNYFQAQLCLKLVCINSNLFKKKFLNSNSFLFLSHCQTSDIFLRCLLYGWCWLSQELRVLRISYVLYFNVSSWAVQSDTQN